MIIKGIIVGLFFLALSGCASFIANEITSPRGSKVKGNISEWAVPKEMCDNNLYCITAIGLDHLEAAKHSLSFDYNISDKRKVWRFEANNHNSKNAKPLTDHLILLFAGYGQPTEILYIHQRWLKLITGAEVLVVPSADKSAQFKFGLDYTSAIVAEVERLQPTKVHLIGFSMGAVAASEIGQQLDNARLYLIAPMTDFEHSAQAIWDILHRDKLYAAFISQDTLSQAIQLVYQKANVTPAEIDLVAKLDDVRSPTFIYLSKSDRVVDVAAWNKANNQSIYKRIYEQLNHLEMMVLFKQEFMADFVSDLLERTVSISEIETLGILCDANDTNCFKQ